MSTAGLKTTVKLETDANGSKLVDSASGRSMPLTDNEALLLDFWDGSPDLGSLMRAAAEASLRLEPAQIEVLLTRLHKAGFLAVEPRPVSAAEAAVPLLQPEDVLPRFRRDLQLVESTKGRRSTQVKDPTTARSFTLFDFELSIARMLDGKRTAASVIDGAGKIGIPVTLESLRTYVAQLRAFGFLEEGASPPPAADTTWGQRRTWSPAVRALFQRALKLSREGQPQAALPVLAELLALEQENVEARELAGAVQSAHEKALAAELTFAEFHGGSGQPAAAGEPAVSEPRSPSLAGEVRKSLLGAMDVSTLVATAPVAAPEPPPLPSSSGDAPPISPDELEQVLPRRRNRRALAGLVLAVVVACVGYFVRPVPWQVSVTGRVDPVDVARPTAPRAGVVLSLEVRPGSEVKQGTELAKLDSAGLLQTVDELEKTIVAAEGRVRELKAEPCDPKVRERVTAKLTAAQKEVEAVRQAQETARALADPTQRERELTALESTLRVKLKALARVEGEHEELTLDKALEAAKQTVEATRAQVEATRALMAASSSVTAPAAGLFLPPPDAIGLKLAGGDSFGRIVSRTAKVSAPGPFAATLPVPEGKLDTQILKRRLANEAWVDGPAGRSLEATVEVTDTSVYGKPVELELTFGTRPYYREVFGP